MQANITTKAGSVYRRANRLNDPRQYIAIHCLIQVASVQLLKGIGAAIFQRVAHAAIDLLRCGIGRLPQRCVAQAEIDKAWARHAHVRKLASLAQHRCHLLGNLARLLAQWLGKLECDIGRKITKLRLWPRQLHRRCLLIKSVYCITNRLFHDYSIQQMRHKNNEVARRLRLALGSLLPLQRRLHQASKERMSPEWPRGKLWVSLGRNEVVAGRCLDELHQPAIG